MKTVKKIGLYALAALMFSACSKDNLADSGITATTVDVPISFSVAELADAVSGDQSVAVVSNDYMEVKAMPVVETRGVAAKVEETKINSLQVLQFNGTAGTAAYVAGGRQENIGATGTTDQLSFPLKGSTAADQTLLFVANFPQELNGNGKTLAQVQDEVISGLDIYMNDGTAAAKALPMACVYKGSAGTGVKIDFNTPITGVALKYLYAKLNLTVKKTVSGTFNNLKAELKNVPNCSRVVPTASVPTGTTGLYPTANDMQSYVLPSFAFDKAYTLYVPENWQGKTTTTAAGDKDGSSHTAATYLEVSGIYPGKDYKVNYSIYLGADASSYNVERGTAYTVTATIKGDNKADKRVKIDPIDLGAAANCYIVNQGNMEYMFKPYKGPGGAALPTTGVTYSVLWSYYPNAASQTKNDIVTDSSIKYEDGYVKFTTAGSWGTAREGNAVIVAKQGTTVLWSWHIWSTAYKPTAVTYTTNGQLANAAGTAGNGTNITRQVMTYLLGAHAAGSTADVNNADARYLSYGMLYQWGRKDPFVPGNKTEQSGADFKGTSLAKAASATAEGWYAIAYNATGQTNNNNVNYAIAHPTYFIYGLEANTYDWTAKDDTLWGNAWTGGEYVGTTLVNKAATTKSAYDPCPAGWRVAPQDTFTRFTQTGANATNADQVKTAANVVVASSTAGAVASDFKNGWTFYYSAWRSGATLYWPASGYRNRDSGALNDVGAWGGSWSSSPAASGSANASNLNFRATNVNPLNSNNRANGLPVRCVKYLHEFA